MEFFNNKRLLIVLSGVACIMIALVVFVMSVIGFGNIGAFFGGKPSQTQQPTSTPTSVQTPTPTVPPSQTPDYFVPTTPPVTTAPPTDVPTEVPTETPDGTELPSESPLETPTPPPTEIPVIGIRIEGARAYTLTVGTEIQLIAQLLPAGAKETIIQWESTNKAAAFVDSEGLVIAREAGTTYIKVSAPEYGFFDQITITVTAPATPTPTPTPTPNPTVEPTPTPTTPVSTQDTNPVNPGPTGDPSGGDDASQSGLDVNAP